VCLQLYSPTTMWVSASPVFASNVRENGRSTHCLNIVGSMRRATVLSMCRLSTILYSPNGLHWHIRLVSLILDRHFRLLMLSLKGLTLMRLDYIITAICSAWRFGPLGPTPLRDSRCTFPLRGLAQDYLIFRLRLPLSSPGLMYASHVNVQVHHVDQGLALLHFAVTTRSRRECCRKQTVGGLNHQNRRI
jgi:hypothetical protein